MACTDINNFLQSEANRLINAPTQRYWALSPWDSNRFVAKTTWPNNMGAEPNVLRYNRSMPLNTPITFETVGFNEGPNLGNGTCSPPTAIIVQSTSRYSMQLKQAAVESERFCVNDARMAYNTAQQASYALKNLNQNVKNSWRVQRQREFTDMVANKVVADTSMTPNATSFATGVTIGQLNRQMLDYWYDRLVADGTYENNTLSTDEFGQPVLPIVLSREAQATLVNNDQTLNNIRWNREAVPKLIGPRGSFVFLEGFKHWIDIQAPRWNLVGGTWVEVPFYLPVANAGDQSEVNPAYYTADYEDLFILHPDVVKFAIPSSAIPSGPLKFNAVDYMGDFKWLNILDNDCNKDGTTGYFRALMSYAAQPGNPQAGVVIRFRRCPEDWIVDANCCS